ncbi:MAG TPA: cyclase family protein [Hymenobacter sp.]
MRIIDLSCPIDTDVQDPLPLSVVFSSHEEGAAVIGPQLFGVPSSAFPDGLALAGETLTLNSHAGTHIDAPWHYGPTSEGKPARTIDQLPLEWFYGDAVVLDFTDKPAGYEFSAADVQQKLTAINYKLKPFDIVLVRCDADKKMYEPEFAKIHVGASVEATRWLIDQGIKVMGTDGWGWDTPLHVQSADYHRNPRPGVVWAAHFVGREREYCQIEKLANLDQLPPFGFKISVFPIKIKGGSGGWTRAVAFVNEE